MAAALRQRLEASGASFGELAGRPVVRHFGDGAAEYRAVRDAAGLAPRLDLAQLRMWGRDPVKMLNGLITSDLAAAAPGQGVYGALLTPKGRMLADLRAFRRERPDGTELLIDLAIEALAGTREHLKKYVPPLFARWEEVSGSGVLGVYGPAAAECVAGLFGALPKGEEDGYLEAEYGDGPVLIARTRYAGLEDGYDIFCDDATSAALWDALLQASPRPRPVGLGALDTLRIEAGRPRYGAEMTEETIATEAFEATGLLSRAISFRKGCYTGQEVIVRIAHRGHVNRHVRGLLLGEAPAPGPRTPLHHPDTGRDVGWTTSAAYSPLRAQTVALAYVRREVQPGSTVHLGSADGAPAAVVQLPF